MDLRVKRTKKCIYDAFIEIRKNKSLEKITIAELSKAAMINKTTFYKHYRDIYDLSDQIQDSLIEDIFAEAKYIETLHENPKIYCGELYEAFAKETELINILFSGNEKQRFGEKLEKLIKKKLLEQYSEGFQTIEHNIIFSVLLRGMLSSTELYTGYGKDYAVEVLGNMIDAIMKNYKKVGEPHQYKK